MMATEFINAQQMALDHPDTFEAPTITEIMLYLALGNNPQVKVCTGDERFWVEVTNSDGNTITGTVNNDLVRTNIHGLKYGDEITFNIENIYQLLSDIN